MDAYKRGQRVQNLKLLEPTTKIIGGKPKKAWRCRTDDGDIVVLITNDIRKREQRGRQPTKTEVCVTRAYYSYKRNCQRRNMYLGLTKDQFGKIILKNCVYCGAPPSNGGQRIEVKYNGLDRKDNKKGYTPSNCVPCCKTCNSIKGEHLSYSEMVEVAKLLKKMRGKRRSGSR